MSGSLIAVLAALAALSSFATSILIPSLPDIAATFGVSAATAGETITAFFGAFAVGQLVVGPVSDHYGRRPVIFGGIAIFVCGSLICLFARSMPALLVGRVIQALGATAPSVLSRAVARDLFEGKALARLLAFITVAIAAAPGFSPLIGGAMQEYSGWRASFVLVIAFALGLAIAYRSICGETFRKPNAPLRLRAVLAEYKGLLTNRAFIIPAGSLGLLIGALFAFFAASAAIWIDEVRLVPFYLGVLFALTVFVVFGAGMLAARLAKTDGLVKLASIGLVLSYFGGAAFFGSAYILKPTVASLIIPFIVFAAGMGFANPLMAAIALSPFGDRAGAASSLLGFLQMVVAAVGSIAALWLSESAALSTGLVLAFCSGAASLIFMCNELRSEQY